MLGRTHTVGTSGFHRGAGGVLWGGCEVQAEHKDELFNTLVQKTPNRKL